MGLKLRLAAYWLLVCLLLAASLFVAADRLMRQQVLSQKADEGRALLEQLSSDLSSCAGDIRQCPRWQTLRNQPPAQLWAICLLDQGGVVLDSSRAALRAESWWDALADMPPMAMERALYRCGDRRCLWLRRPIAGQSISLLLAVELEPAYEKSRALGRTLFLFSVLLAVAAAFGGWLATLMLLVRPLERLLRRAEDFSDRGPDSVDPGAGAGTLEVAFRRLWRRIEEDRDRLRQQIQRLEQLNRELRLTQQSLLRSEKLASVGRLAAGVAHEVGNPLSAILGYLNLLKDEKTTPGERQDMLQRVEEEIERIDGVIRSLLNYSRPAPPNAGPVSARDAAESALQLIRPQKEFKNIAFQMEIDAGLPDCRADAALLRQVLVNLMLNALDALRPGGRLWLRAAAVEHTARGARWRCGGETSAEGEEPPCFAAGELHQVRLPRDGKWLAENGAGLAFSVADDGCGIAEENLLKVFDPFFSTKEPGRGTGLGLAICHSAIEAMGGEIWLWSRPGIGTQVSFILPLDKRTA